MKKGRILLVEDEKAIYEILRTQIEQLGYDLDYASDGSEGLALAVASDYSLVILDRNLPGIGGLEILREIRKVSATRQVLLLTSMGAELDRVLGLELGADDYVVKPFSLPELVSRIRARLRSSEASPGPAPQSVSSSSEAVLRFGEIDIDAVRRQVKKSGTILDLTALEFDLIAFLAKNAGIPFDRKTLLDAVWGYTIPEYEANVNVTINRVRRKIETDPQQPQYLLTVRGVGYKWCEPDATRA